MPECGGPAGLTVGLWGKGITDHRPTRGERSAALGGVDRSLMGVSPRLKVSDQLRGHDGVQAEDVFGHVRVAVIGRWASPDNQEARLPVEIELVIRPEFPGFWYSGDVDVQGRIVVLAVAQEPRVAS